MFEFKKNKSSEKILTEKEIQQKLYGRFLNATAVAGASEAPSKPARPASATAGATGLFPEDHSDDFSAARPAEAVSEIRPAASESAALKPAAKSKPAASFSSYQAAAPKKNASQVRWSEVFEKLGDGLAAAAGGLWRFLSGIFRVLDVRKESVRTVLAWGGGALVLVLLLAAIHGLNAKRELAMKSAPHKAKLQTARIKKESPLKPAEPTQEAAVPAADAAALTPEQAALQAPPAAAETQTAAKETAPSAAKGRFVIQVATYVIKDDADRLMQDLKKSEPRVFVKGLTRSSGKTYYSVFIGRFKTFQDAQQAIAGFKKTDLARSFKDAFIRTLDS